MFHIRLTIIKQTFKNFIINKISKMNSFQVDLRGKRVDEALAETEKFIDSALISGIEFVNIMRNTSALIGNSSMGILEAPFYKLPVVNVGRRQSGRLNAGNVEFVDYKIDQIILA